MSKIIVKDLAGPSSSSNKIYIASGSELDIANSSGTINLAVDAADIASGTLSNARLAAGHILQVKYAKNISIVECRDRTSKQCQSPLFNSS